MWPAIIAVAADIFKGWGERRKAKVEAKAKIEVARAEAETARLAKLADAEISWDQEMSRQADKSIKDEFWTFTLAVPLYMLFIPGLSNYALQGFERMEAVPDWYLAAVGLAIGAAFGYRKMIDYMTRRNGK